MGGMGGMGGMPGGDDYGEPDSDDDGTYTYHVTSQYPHVMAGT